MSFTNSNPAANKAENHFTRIIQLTNANGGAVTATEVPAFSVSERNPLIGSQFS
jgi:hypothetical protein